MTRESYEQDLREHLRECRRARPIPLREELSALDEAQCRILGGHLIRWLRDWGPRLLQERAALGAAFGPHAANPLICFHTSVPGYVAAREILGEEHERVAIGLREDFAEFSYRDERFVFHVELISFFTQGLAFMEAESSRTRRILAEQYPLREGEEYWYHHDESVMGPLFARSGLHLWKWNGQEMALLEEAFRTWVS